MRIVFVHGACVKDGSWWWHRAAEALGARGISSIAPGLPSCGEAGAAAGAEGPGLPEDVAAVRSVLEQGDEETIVVAHSYGGIVAAEAAAEVATVRHLVLISSYLPEVGQSLTDFGDGAPASFLDPDPEAGTFGVRAELLADTFLQDCDVEVRSQAAAHLARQSLKVTTQGVRAAAWTQLPTAYVVCADDRGTPAHLQREFAKKATHTFELQSGHHPFLSQPVAVRDLVLNL